MPEAAFVIELGCYLVGEAGIYVSRVIDRKVSRGQVFLVTDGGLHRHLAASGNFGQMVRKNYPVTIGNRADAADREVASVVGRCALRSIRWPTGWSCRWRSQATLPWCFSRELVVLTEPAGVSGAPALHRGSGVVRAA